MNLYKRLKSSKVLRHLTCLRDTIVFLWIKEVRKYVQQYYHGASTLIRDSYKRLLMGIACAPDAFQSIMMDLLDDLDYLLVCIDNILLLQRHGKREEDHFKKM